MSNSCKVPNWLVHLLQPSCFGCRHHRVISEIVRVFLVDPTDGQHLHKCIAWKWTESSPEALFLWLSHCDPCQFYRQFFWKEKDNLEPLLDQLNLHRYMLNCKYNKMHTHFNDKHHKVTTCYPPQLEHHCLTIFQFSYLSHTSQETSVTQQRNKLYYGIRWLFVFFFFLQEGGGGGGGGRDLPVHM